MKYEGSRQSKCDDEKTVYIFSLGRDELEVALKVLQTAHKNTPLMTDTQIYKHRLRNITKVLGRVFVEEIKGKLLPTKRTNRTHKTIENFINKKYG